MSQSDKYSSAPINFAGISSPFSDYNSAKVVILPIPYDATSEWHKGSKYGPRTIIEASEFLELYDHEMDSEIYKIGIHTLPDLEITDYMPDDMIETVYQRVDELLEKSKFIISLGGEHTVSIGIARAYKKHYDNLSVLHLDAHADLRDEYNGTKLGQATVIRRIMEFCPVIQTGIRSLSIEEKTFIDDRHLDTYFLPENRIDTTSINKIINSLTENVYITLDLDVLDPSIMPAVGLPEPGGLFWHEVLDVLKSTIQRRNVVGIDLVELCPEMGPPSCAFLTAKLVYKIIGYRFS